MVIDEKTRVIMKSLSVLYVEDETGIRDQLTDSLKRKFGVVYAEVDGQKGFDCFQANRPDLVITDIKMPVMDGLQMVELIRKEDEHIPIIIITAFSDLENLKQAIELDVDRFIQKPPQKDELDRVLFKATQSIIKQAEIDDRDRIIQTILGWQPYFSIICNETEVEHVTADFVKTLGYKDHKSFLNSLSELTWIRIDEYGDETNLNFQTLNELFQTVSNSEGCTFIVKLISKNGKTSEIPFHAKAQYFSKTCLYLISFFK